MQTGPEVKQVGDVPQLQVPDDKHEVGDTFTSSTIAVDKEDALQRMSKVQANLEEYGIHTDMSYVKEVKPPQETYMRGGGVHQVKFRITQV